MSIWWNSVADFLAMGGYGLYVWGSFGGTVLVLGAEMCSLRARRRALHTRDDDIEAAGRAGAPVHES